MPRAARAKPFYTVDAETDPFKAGRVSQPFIWGVYEGQGENYWEFDTAVEVVEFFADKEVLVYAHNGGKFDYHYLRDDINSDELIGVIAGRMAKFKIGAAEFRDSINVLVAPLRDFAKEEIDYSKLELAVRAQHMDEIKRYLRSDCVNLWNALHTYFSRFGRTLTQAGAAYKYWARKSPVKLQRQTAKQNADYREYYYGGRVQCFTSGCKTTPFQVVDANSAYPNAMLYAHPFSPGARVDTHLPSEGNLHKCFVRLDAIARGCFPWRDPEGDRSLFFPDDDRSIREYFITGYELKAALEMDAVKIVSIKEVHHFPLIITFQEYVNDFYEQRKIAKANGDKAGDIFAKIFLNSLYGKFASNPERYNEYMLATDDSLARWKKQGYERLGPWGDRHLIARPLPDDKHRYYNVCTAASITGYVRAELFKAICQAQNPLYCDTDSLAASDVSRVPLGKELGQWKFELQGLQYAIAGKKTYAFLGYDPAEVAKVGLLDAVHWKMASKGARLTVEQIREVATGRTIIYDPEVPTYSIHSAAPQFVRRVIKNTAKDIRKVLAA